MRHPGDGLLRRLLDEPDGVADSDRSHVDDCATCGPRLAQVSGDALDVGAALSFDGDVDVDAGWERLLAGLENAPARPVKRRGRSVRTPVVAVAGVLALLGGASAAAAGNWFPIFRTEQVAPITVPQADLVQLPELDEFGTMRVESRPEVRDVGDARAAREATGLASPRITDLPTGVAGQPRFLVGDRVLGVFTFDRAKAEKALGRPIPEPPAGLVATEFRLTAGPGLAAVWPGNSGAPALMIGRVVAPKAFSNGIPFETARDYLLSLPGLPTSVSSQLKAFTKEGGTLPLIVNQASESSFTTTVGKAPATVLSTSGGAVSAVLWVQDGFVNAVGGSLSTGEVLRVAREIRWAQ
ncbi:hypothetical protein Aph02nite_30400 [Actinoplanes philippinensis]|uniref:DUF4367 domain-containing protein n=1 Tax=Actinoplanes philippinensis TaxID=35752 RepID=A0A1I2EEH1_9ACTN|nr:hypothetical protein [Actinoplanes philippinensis]GIE77090.1 hypothetical protein Aph02nite_30400 [Actinoplanes philippinensis]SFE90640.1 hypothetical protein SAMN05421541_104366 [Actinoplanes philippinensis]